MQPAIHTPSIMWLLGCEFLYQCLIFIPCLPPVISLVPNGLCRIWLYGEQIHLAFDIGSLYEHHDYQRDSPPLAKHCLSSSWEGK